MQLNDRSRVILLARCQASSLCVAVLFFSWFVTACAESRAQEKVVIAHYMTDMLPSADRVQVNRWINPELSDPLGSTKMIGGVHQTLPMATLRYPKATLQSAVAFEIRAALQLGIDGFQFYYPLVDATPNLAKTYNAIIAEFIRQSEIAGGRFKVSLCFSHPHTSRSLSETEKLKLWAPPIRELLEETRDSPAWLRSHSGNLLFFLWVGDAMAGGVEHTARSAAQVRAVATAYDRFAKELAAAIDFVYHLQSHAANDQTVRAVTESFPYVWGWTSSDEERSYWDGVAEQCKANGCRFTQSVYPDYYTSKVYRRGANHEVLSTDEATQSGLDFGERHYRVTDLSKTQRGLLEDAIRRDASIINYVTWNDYPEGHHIAPERSHNFGPSLLLRHYKRIWKTGETRVDAEQAILFFKKYPHNATPKYEFPLMVKSREKDLSLEDEIEVVTILKAPADVFVNGHALGEVGSGLQANRIPLEIGPVTVRVVRDDHTFIKFRAPVAITGQPVRTDRLTYSYSSEFENECVRLFTQEDSR